MSESKLEWNLAFAQDEVIAGLEKLLTQAGHSYTRTDTEGETRFQATLPQGVLHITVQPLSAHRSPFNLPVVLHRTLLIATGIGLSPEEEKAFRHALTLAFLRVGG
jgi:hypothetical protein